MPLTLLGFFRTARQAGRLGSLPARTHLAVANDGDTLSPEYDTNMPVLFSWVVFHFTPSLPYRGAGKSCPPPHPTKVTKVLSIKK